MTIQINRCRCGQKMVAPETVCLKCQGYKKHPVTGAYVLPTLAKFEADDTISGLTKQIFYGRDITEQARVRAVGQ